jgi:hypothetical protein
LRASVRTLLVANRCKPHWAQIGRGHCQRLVNEISNTGYQPQSVHSTRCLVQTADTTHTADTQHTADPQHTQRTAHSLTAHSTHSTWQTACQLHNTWCSTQHTQHTAHGAQTHGAHSAALAQPDNTQYSDNGQHHLRYFAVSLFMIRQSTGRSAGFMYGNQHGFLY